MPTPPATVPVKCLVCSETIPVAVTWTADGAAQLVAKVSTEEVARHVRDRHLKYP